MKIHPEAYIHPRSEIIGDVEIGKDSSIWPMVVLRGDMGKITISDSCSVQDGTVVHATKNLSETYVGNRVTIGHRVILHGCTVEDDCLIGMGAILLDNCVIGRGSLVGAGSLVTANTKIPPGSLVMGSPAKVIRPVNERETSMMAANWATYVEHIKSL